MSDARRGETRARVDESPDTSLPIDAIDARHARQDDAWEHLFEALFGAASDAVLVLGQDGYYLRVNQRAVELLGYSEAELRGMQPADLLSENVRAEDLVRDAAAIRAGGAVVARYEMRRKDGYIVPVEISAWRIAWSGTAFIGIVRDLSELMAVEAARRQAAEVAEALARERGAVLASLDEGVIVFDANGRLRDANAAALRLTGVDLESGQSIEECGTLVAPRDLEGRALNWADLVRRDAAQQGANAREIVVGDGENARVLQCQSLPLHGQAPRDGGLVCVLRDVTHERARAQMQASFAGAIVHELRTPLTSLVGFLDLALDKWAIQPDERRRAQVSKAQQAAQRLRRLLEDMLLIARLDAGVVPVTTESVPLAPLARDAVVLLRAAYPGQRVQVRGMAGLAVQADRGLLLQVLSNLLDNAAKYSPEGAAVRLEAGSTGDEALIRVIDHGVGIAASDLPRLFQRFARPNKTARSGSAGTGLGLSICRSLVEAMGGEIAVRSTVGVGSAFTVRLPRSGASHAPAAATAAGLPTGPAFHAMIQAAIERTGERPLSLVALSTGADHIEASHDDARLEGIQTAAGALRSALRLRDLLGYDSAGSFLALLPDTGATEAALVAARMRAAVEGLPAAGGATRRHVSAGIATYPADAASATDLIAAAKAAHDAAPVAPPRPEPRIGAAELPAYFAVAVSHELRTPLTTVLGSADAVLRSWARLDNAARRKGVERILSGARRLDLLVRDLLLVTGLEEGELVVRPQIVALIPLLEQAIYDVSAAHPNLDVRARGWRAAPTVWADPDRVQQIVEQLLDNAARHGQGAGPPEVRVERHVGEVEIRVSDRGPGLPREGRERLFTRFGKLSSESHAGRVGTGLGLYICRRLVEQMGGSIGVISTPGKGASFWFTLPLAAGEPSQVAAEEPGQ